MKNSFKANAKASTSYLTISAFLLTISNVAGCGAAHAQTYGATGVTPSPSNTGSNYSYSSFGQSANPYVSSNGDFVSPLTGNTGIPVSGFIGQTATNPQFYNTPNSTSPGIFALEGNNAQYAEIDEDSNGYDAVLYKNYVYHATIVADDGAKIFMSSNNANNATILNSFGSTMQLVNNWATFANIENAANSTLLISGDSAQQSQILNAVYSPNDASVMTIINSNVSGATISNQNQGVMNLSNDNASNANVTNYNLANISGQIGFSNSQFVNSGNAIFTNASILGAQSTAYNTPGATEIFSGNNTIQANITDQGTTLINGANGGSNGILTVNGNFTQSTAGKLIVSINPTQNNAAPVAGIDYDQLAVNGTASLNGNVLVNVNTPAPGSSYVVGSKYNVVQAASISGNAIVTAPMSENFAKYLTFTRTIVQNGNQQDYVVSPVALNGPNGAPGPAFTSGSFYGASFYAQNAALFDTLSAPVGSDADYWMHGIGSFGHSPSDNYNYKGFVIGRGFAVTPRLIIGGAVSNVYTHTAGSNDSHADSTSVGGLAYGIYSMPKWTITGTATIGHLGTRATRYLPLVGTGKFATNGVYGGASLRADYNWIDTGRFFATPYATVSYIFTNTGSGQETGLNQAFNMNLRYGRVNTNLAKAGGGLVGGFKTTTNSALITTWASLGGLGTLGNTHTRVQETLGMQSTGITSEVASTGALTPAAGIQLAGKSSPWKLSADWGGQFARRANSQAFMLSGGYKF